jgi:hypothetical protein
MCTLESSRPCPLQGSAGKRAFGLDHRDFQGVPQALRSKYWPASIGEFRTRRCAR